MKLVRNGGMAFLLLPCMDMGRGRTAPLLRSLPCVQLVERNGLSGLPEVKFV